MNVPFIDLKRDTSLYAAEYRAGFERVLESGVFSLGPEVEVFEQSFATYLGASHVIGVSNGTMALYAGMLALGIGPGDEVIVQANTFIATAEAIRMTGAVPIFCDVKANTYQIDSDLLEYLVTPRTKAICVVHLYGHPMPRLLNLAEWARAKNLYLIEDVSQAHGAMLHERKIGTFGDIAAFSCYPTKNLGALGEGGILAVKDKGVAIHARAIRTHGILEQKYRHDLFGSNLKMEALQGAFLQIKLARLDRDNERRRQIAERYREGLRDAPWLKLPPVDTVDQKSVYHLFVVQVEDRQRCIEYLKIGGIGSGIHYPIPLHEQPSMQPFASRARCPIASQEAPRLMSLPLFPLLEDKEVDYVIERLHTYPA